MALATNLDAFSVASAKNSIAAIILLRSCGDLVLAAGSRSCSYHSQSSEALLRNEAAEDVLTAQAAA